MQETFDYDFAEYNWKIRMQVFLESLDYKSQTKIIAYIDKLIELLNIDPFPNQKISKFLKDGIFELRLNLRNKTSRSLYFFVENKMIVFTHGFFK